MGSLNVSFHKFKPYAAMIFLQFGFAGLIIFSVALLKQGMSHYVLVVYRNVAATVFMAPFALLFERKVRPKMTLSTFLKIMALALLETVLDQNLYFLGVKLTSGSYAAALINMLPAITFVIAVLLRMEKIKLKTTPTQAKIAGTLITIVGALVMILYKGPILEFVWTKGRSHKAMDATQQGSDFLKGTFMLIGACFCWSSFFVLQSHTLKHYQERIKVLCSCAIGGGVVDLSEVLYQFSTGTIFRSTTGDRPDGEKTRRFCKLVDEATILLSGVQIDAVFPSLGWIGMLTGMDRKLKELFKKWDAFLGEIVDEKKKGESTGGEEDFVDVLLSLQKNPDMDFALSKDDIKSLVMDINAAGTDTTRTVLEWTMSELIKNPQAMSKAKCELSEVGGGKPTITEDDLPHLHYLKAVLKEVLRLHPPAPLLMPHESMEETRLHGYMVPKKTRVIVNVWALGRDPRWWDSPEEFSPERFLVEEEGGGRGDYKGQDFRFLPFGSGRRSCPGIQFAMVTAELAVANLIHQFEWAVPPGEEELDMAEAPGITVKRAVPLRVVARPCHS